MYACLCVSVCMSVYLLCVRDCVCESEHSSIRILMALQETLWFACCFINRHWLKVVCVCVYVWFWLCFSATRGLCMRVSSAHFVHLSDWLQPFSCLCCISRSSYTQCNNFCFSLGEDQRRKLSFVRSHPAAAQLFYSSDLLPTVGFRYDDSDAEETKALLDWCSCAG